MQIKTGLEANRRNNTSLKSSTQTSKAAELLPELLWEIISYLQDSERAQRLNRIALHSIPLVCKRWHGIGTRNLYHHITLVDGSTLEAQLLLRTLKARGFDLTDRVTALSFPELRLTSRERGGHNDKRVAKVLACYARIMALCRYLVTLSVPANLHITTPCPLLPISPDDGLHPPNSINPLPSPFMLHPLQSSFSTLRELEFKGVTITLSSNPDHTLFPYFPSLETLMFTNCLINTEAMQYICTRLKGSLKHLSIRNCIADTYFVNAFLPIIGPSLEGFEIDEGLWVAYPFWHGGRRGDEGRFRTQKINQLLPYLSTFSLIARCDTPSALQYLPTSIRKLYVTNPGRCSRHEDKRYLNYRSNFLPYLDIDVDEAEELAYFEPVHPFDLLLRSISCPKDNFFGIYPSLREIVISADAPTRDSHASTIGHVKSYCELQGVELTLEPEDACELCLGNTRRLRSKLRVVVRRASRAIGSYWATLLNKLN